MMKRVEKDTLLSIPKSHTSYTVICHSLKTEKSEKLHKSHKSPQAGNGHELELQKVHRVIGFNREYLLKSYIELNTNWGTRAKNDFEKYFFNFMNNSVIGKTMESVKEARGIKLVTADRRRFHLVLEPNYHTTKW